MFTEIWLLNKNNTAYNYPSIVMVNHTISVTLGVRNRMEHSMYYMIRVKLRNQTQHSPDSNNSKPMLNIPAHEIFFFIPNGGVWESNTSIKVLDAVKSNNSLNVTKISINGMPIEGEFISNMDDLYQGYIYQLVFELWYFDTTVDDFIFHDRFVSLWLIVKSN